MIVMLLRALCICTYLVSVNLVSVNFMLVDYEQTDPLITSLKGPRCTLQALHAVEQFSYMKILSKLKGLIQSDR